LLALVLKQHAEMGFEVLVIFTGHFSLEQTLATKRAALNAMKESRATILPFTTYDLVIDFYSGDHAGIGETSLMMALRPDLVRFSDWPHAEPLPGVIGADPRPSANADFGHRIFNESAARAAFLVSGVRSSTFDRELWIATLEVVVDVLARMRDLRQLLPRDQLPPITTPDYLQGWSAVAQGRLTEARECFREKLAALQSSKPVS